MTAKKTSSQLIVAGNSGNPRKQASQTSYTPLNQKQEAIRKLARGKIKRSGANGSTTTSSVSSARGVSQSPLYYDPRHATPDKFHFPRDRATANSIWRNMYRTDTCTAISTDMYADMPWSDFRLQGIEDKKVKQIYEDMFNDLNLVPKLPLFTRDYLITGELILHAIFNASKGYWDQVISHNPDYVKVQGIGITSTQPLLWLKPTSEIKKLVSSPDPRVRKYVNTLPKEIVMAFRSNKEIPLDALNTTYIPRKEVSSDVRGTSMYTRLYRYNMYEDFIVNASLAIAQRNAAPTRLVKLGDREGNWMPTEDDIDSMIELFSLAESDPFAAVFTHPFVEVEYVGVSDRVLLISREWEFIERAKLLAMGIAKSFLIGETSFASAVAGLQVLMNRLSSLRDLIENEWIIQKLCKPVAEMNEFYKAPSRAELEHRIRIKKPEERELIIPTIKWSKGLETTLDVSVLGVWQNLYEKGFLSERTYASGAGVDLDIERKNLEEERKYKEARADELGIPVEQLGDDEFAAPGGETGGGLPFGSSKSAPPPMESAQNDMLRVADSKGKVYIEDAMSILSKMNSSEANHVLTKISKQHTGSDLNILTGE